MLIFRTAISNLRCIFVTFVCSMPYFNQKHEVDLMVNATIFIISIIF